MALVETLNDMPGVHRSAPLAALTRDRATGSVAETPLRAVIPLPSLPMSAPCAAIDTDQRGTPPASSRGLMFELYDFTFSHYSEKARWALDFKGVPYTPRHLSPGFHMRTTRKLHHR